MAVRTYITETEFAKIDNPQSSTTYIVLDDNDPTLVKKVVFKTNNINNEGELYIVQDEYPTPSGAVEITANANNIDVKQYATANVNVPNPSTGTLNITENDDYDVTEYAGVSVNVPNPSTGTLNITSNDTYDVTNYASAEVNVPQPSGKITITSNGTDIDIAQYAAVDVNVPNPSTGSLEITSNNTYDVTNYASVDVNVSTGEQKTCKFKIAGNGNFTFNKLGDGKYYLKKNDGEWTEYTTSQTVSVVNGDVIELKSDLIQINTTTVLKINNNSNLRFEVEGDLLGTLYGDVLPPGGCYGIFEYCSGLTKVPSNMFANYDIIPANFCSSMFAGCSSLESAPTLSATIIGNGGYSNMFALCSGLTTAPELPATTLAESCYYSMFYGCTSLTTAPVLPATSLSTSCYREMFYGCTLLNYVKCLATNISAFNCTKYWVQNVAATGTFVKNTNTTWSTGTSGIPNGWTIQDAV